jgi:glycosyltransferase involved in cell wall biosynthesis
MRIKDVTVIVPTRNEARNIDAFLASLPEAVELIVVDASQDATPELVKVLRPNHTLLLRHPARIAQARQIGAEAASTDWLLFTDADVVFAPDYFDRLAADRGHCDALYGPKLSCDEFTRYYGWLARGQRLADALGIPAASGSNLLVNKRVLMSVGGFDLQLTCNEDSELGWRIKRHGYRIAFASDLAVIARDHRRLYRGAWRKTLHSLARCALLYLNLVPRRWRGDDWGYWSS